MDVYIPTNDGQWVSEKYEQLAQTVQDYDHNLELRWIPPALRTREDKKPYVIWDTLSNSPVLYASELDTPQDILASLFMADNVRGGNVLDRIDAINKAAEALRLRAQLDEHEIMKDKVAFLKGTPLHYIKMGRDENGSLIKMDDSRRRI